MIEEQITASDRFQIEMKSSYALRRDQPHTSYTIEFYFFVPGSLGINDESYPKYLFYRDIQTYVRFKTPAVLLRDIASSEDSPLQALKKSFEALARKQDNSIVKHYEVQNKMFCSILRSAMRGQVNLITNPHDPADVEHMLKQYLKDLQIILDEFRKLRAILTVPTVNEELFSIFTFSDEYISLTVEQLTFEIMEVLKDDQGELLDKYIGQMIELISSEVNYREQRQYPSVVDAKTDNEGFVYRRDVLKSFNESILLLNTRLRDEGKIVEQVVYSIAAGLAMVFATGVAFYTQAKYGNFTMIFFVALVVSYMLKDRMKELVRMYLNDKIQNLFYDHKLTICGGSSRNRLGYSRESFRFVSKHTLDREIKRIRNPDQFSTLDTKYAGERVILYRKNIKIFSRKFDQIYHDQKIQRINDITRINIARFMRKMENPKKTLFVADEKGYQKIRGSKVYHINLVVRYCSDEGPTFNRFRIVLNRRGIKRIEATDIP